MKSISLNKARLKAENMFSTIYRNNIRKFLSARIYTILNNAHKNFDDWSYLGFDSRAEFIHDAKRMASNDHREVMEKVDEFLNDYRKATTFKIVNMMIESHYEIEFLKDRLKAKEQEVKRLEDHLFNYSNRELKAV